MKREVIFAAALLFFLMNLQVQAIRVCHDYTYYRVFRTDPDPPGGVMAKKAGYYSADALRKELKKAGYICYPAINSYQLPNFPKFLKPGYVVIVEDAHSGIINDKGNVDHFLQMSNSIGKYYQVAEVEKKYLAPLPNDEKGGLFLNDNWQIFITKRRFSPNPIGKMEIWRK